MFYGILGIEALAVLAILPLVCVTRTVARCNRPATDASRGWAAKQWWNLAAADDCLANRGVH